MPMPEFSSEQSGTAILPSEAMPSPDSGTWAAVKGSAASSLVGSAVTAAKGALGDQTFVPYADASKEMKDNGYDPSVLPSAGLSRGYLNALQDQQKAIQTDAHNADQAGLRHTNGIVPSWRGIDEFVGGNVADSPLFVLGGGAMGVGLKAAGVGAELGLAASVGVRAGESAGIMSGYDVARKEFGTVPGDKDIGIYDVAHDAMVTGVLGGVFGAFGKRAPVATGDIAKLERTTEYAKAHGMNPDEVVSSTGAVGIHQVEPSTAKLSAEELKNPEVNKAAAQKVLDELNTRYRGDPEAAAIAYNAGPKAADRWIAAGRNDSVLAAETRGYVERFRDIRNGEVFYRGTKTPDQKSSMGVDFASPDQSYAETFGSVSKIYADQGTTLDISSLGSEAHIDDVFDALKTSIGEDAAEKFVNSNIAQMSGDVELNIYTLFRDPKNIKLLRDAGVSVAKFSQKAGGEDKISAALIRPEPSVASLAEQMPGDPMDNVKQGVADALTDHVPDQTQSSGVRPVWQTPEAEAQIARAQAQPEMAPEAQKITEAATQAVNDAKATHAVLNPEGDTSAFDAHMEAAKAAVQPVADFHSAVEAAFECASIKGFD